LKYIVGVFVSTPIMYHRCGLDSCGSKRAVFQEAIDHSRRKNTLRNEILTLPEFQEGKLHQYSHKTFEEIFSSVYKICKPVDGIGMLTIYDISAAICKYNKINIERVYIVGNGPKRAISLLGIEPQIQEIGDTFVRYVEIHALMRALREKNQPIDGLLRSSKNGDDLENYICAWQRGAPNRLKE
jgi:hypothetical protein